MKKQEILKHLSDQVLEVINYLEEHCDYEQLFEDGLYAMLYIRYQNALSLLRGKIARIPPALAGRIAVFNQRQPGIWKGLQAIREDPLRKAFVRGGSLG